MLISDGAALFFVPLTSYPKRLSVHRDRLVANSLKFDSDLSSPGLPASFSGPSCGAGDSDIVGQLLIGESLAGDAPQQGNKPITISALPLVEAEHLLFDVATEMEGSTLT